MGDLIVGPLFIQWSDSKLFGMPYFHRFNFDFVLPTGEYRKNFPVNVGNNIYTFNPYYAFTLIPTDRLEVSTRLHYLWCSENRDPFVGLGADDTQPAVALPEHLLRNSGREPAGGIPMDLSAVHGVLAAHPLHQPVRLNSVTSGGAFRRTGVNVVPIPRLT